MIEIVGYMIPVVAAIGGIFAGRFIRAQVHVTFPWKDPATISILILALGPVIVNWLAGRDWGAISGIAEALNVVDPSDSVYLASIAGFIAAYFFTYLMSDDYNEVYVNIHTAWSEGYENGRMVVFPMVYYEKDGRLYRQDQDIISILKTVFLGIRCPLNFPLWKIERTTPVNIRTHFQWIRDCECVDVIKETVTPCTKKVWLFTFKYKEYAYMAAPACCSAATDFLVSAANQQKLMEEASRQTMAAIDAKQKAVTQGIARGADLLTYYMNKTPGMEYTQNLITELESRVFPSNAEKQLNAEKKGGFFKRRAKMKKESDEDQMEVEDNAGDE